MHCTQILVDDVEKALKRFAESYRAKFDIPVIGIAGSVGKTTAKEMVASVLAERFNVLKTEKNLNNELGVPLTLFRINPEHEVAVVEMGISDFGEMTRLAKMVKPTMAVYTLIGHAHLEQLHDRNGVLKAKTEMLDFMPADGTVFMNGDDDLLAENLHVVVAVFGFRGNGGGFVFGNTADPNYDCEALARSGGIVMASINYRVGQLGFLSLPELSAESPNHVSGNYGLQDQIAGLEWIKRNISKFGGDPTQITIFGESAGGISVSMLCASPLCQGLFQGAISQSGGSFGPSRPVTTYPGENMKLLADAEQDGLQVMESLGATSLAELRAMDASMFSARGLGGSSWPIVDGYVIPGDQSELYAEGRYNDVNVLIGYNSDEGASFQFGPSTPEYYRRS